MAYNKNLYSSDTDALDAGIIYDQNELMMQDEINAAVKNGDIVVGMADNLASKMNQYSTGEFIERTTGGTASLSDGDGHLVLIRGKMVHEDYIAQSITMTVTPIERDPSAGEFTAQIDNDLFLAEMQDTSGTMVFTYGSSGWDYDPANYGITTNGLPLPGDVISVAYRKENRGTITQSDPQSFVSTGWNLYDHTKGYARALYYDDNCRFGITGTYTAVQLSHTITGSKSTVTPDANGTFGLPSDFDAYYIWVTGGNDTDTAVWMCWSDWTNEQTGKEPNGGEWEAYSESEIDLSTVMTTYFPYGLMQVGSYQDEIDLSLGKATNNVARIAYSSSNLDDIIALGVDYDYDNSYIYYGLTTPVVNTIEIDNFYAAYDHGIEYFTGTEVSVYTQTLYGVNLKNRLERDVVTISQQTLSAAEKTQVNANIGSVAKTGDTMTGGLVIPAVASVTKGDGYGVKEPTYAINGGTGKPAVVPSSNQTRLIVAGFDKNDTCTGYIRQGYYADGSVGFNIAARYLRDGETATNNYLTMKCKQDTVNGTLVDSSTIDVSHPAAWRSAIGAVNIAGDIMTGSLIVNNSAYFVDNTTADATTSPSATKYWTIAHRDKSGNYMSYWQSAYGSNGTITATFAARRIVNSETITNSLAIQVNSAGAKAISVSDPASWRTALGLAATAITVSRNTSVSGLSGNAYGFYDPGTKTVRINGYFSSTSAIALGTTLFTIQSGYRPSSNKTAPGILFNANGAAVSACAVTSSGVITQNFSGSCTSGFFMVEYTL